MVHLYLFPAIEFFFALAITILLFRRFGLTNDRSTYYWMLAFGFYTLYDAMQLLFVSRLFVLGALSYFFLHFIRQTLISLMFVSVYFGIVQLLTDKKILTVILPMTFFGLQELLLAYGDFFVRNIELADKLHVIFFDVPFNMIIAMLFFKLYQVNRKRYSLMIALAWLGYALLVPVYYYTAGNTFIYTISLLPMLVMLLAFLLFYQAPTGESLIEIVPAVEKKLKTPLRYKLRSGHSYLIEEPKPAKAFDVFLDSVMHGVRGLCITRQRPIWVRECYELEKTPVLWLTQLQSETSEKVDPSELEQVVYLVDKFVQKAKSQEAQEEIESTPEIDKYAMSTDELRKFVSKSVEEIKSKEEIKSEENVKPKEEHKATGFEREEPTIEKKPMHEEKPIETPRPHIGKITVIGDEEPVAKKESVKPVVPVPYTNVAQKPVSKFKFAVIGDEAPKREVPKPVQSQPVMSKPLSAPVIKPAFHEVSKFPVKPIPVAPKVEQQKPEPKLEDEKPKYLNTKPKGRFIVIGASDEEKKKIVKNKAYFELPEGKRKSVILLDGLEYIISNNSFDAVKKMITLVKDKISEGESCLIVSVDPGTLSPEHMAQLKAEFVMIDEGK